MLLYVCFVRQLLDVLPNERQTLQLFVKGISQKRGIEKNLWAKKFIKNIIYSKSDIQINLYYSTDSGVFKNSVLPYGVRTGGDKNPQKEQRTSALNHESPQFELCKMAPLSNSLRTVPIILPNTIHQCKKYFPTRRIR